MSLSQEAYVSNNILTADPAELIRLLYTGAIDAVRGARRKLALGDIRGRSAEISRAIDIVGELTLSLDRSVAPELAGNLVEIYDYVLRLLTDANIRQVPEPLAEAESLLATLLDAWSSVTVSAISAAPASDEYTPLHCAF